MPRKPAGQTVQRKDILVAAAEVFQARGYEGATMAEIARKVKLTAGSLYHHFPAGKRDLLLAVLNTALDVVTEQLDQIIEANLSPAETLRQMIAAHVLSLTNNVATGAAMVFEVCALIVLNDDAESRASFLRRRDAFEQRFRRVVEQGIAAGEFRAVDVGVFTKALLGAHNWVSVWYKRDGRLSGQQIADQMADFFFEHIAQSLGGSINFSELEEVCCLLRRLRNSRC